MMFYFVDHITALYYDTCLGFDYIPKITIHHMYIQGRNEL